MAALIIVAIPLLIVGFVLAGWGVDRAIASGKSPRNVVVRDRAVGGLDEEDLEAVLTGMAIDYRDEPVTIITPAGTHETTTGALGVELDVEATSEAVLSLDRREPLLEQPINWMASLAAERQAPVTFRINSTSVEARLADLLTTNSTPPVEPTIQLAEAGWEVVPGEEGATIEIDEVVDELQRAVAADQRDITVAADPVPREPQFTDDDAAELAAEAERLSGSPITVEVADQTTDLQPEALRTLFSPNQADDELSLDYDADRAGALLAFAFADLHVDPTDASFTIGDGPELHPSSNGHTCCVTDAPETLLAALDAEHDSQGIELQVLEPHLSTESAEQLGVIEPIASFTTNHACCQSRVQNIQRMADIVRGALIEPGELFSLNDHVGQRTIANGFTEAGVIYFGEFTEDVGGGVSQFATTLFNAAFFGALDYGEYQSHSIYISRYPYGREATVSYPAPDLQIRNDSPYGVVVWPTYTDSSITVTLWSTKWANADQTGQSESPSGLCTRVQTERTRNFLDPAEAERIRGGPAADGADPAELKDFVFALYQPREGVLC